MAKVREVVRRCSTSFVSGLSQQIIAELMILRPGTLVDISSLIQRTGSAVNPFLQPAAALALQQAVADRGGERVAVASAYRTVAQQYLLRRQKELGICGRTAVALPGRSNHEDGCGMDVEQFSLWRPALERHGWHWPNIPRDPTHFDFQGGNTQGDVGNVGIQAFQRLWNRNNPNQLIAEDGAWGPDTRAALEESPADGFAARRLLELTDPPMTGPDVLEMVQALRAAGLQLAATNVFDAAVDAAVRQFQDQEGLLDDGIVGRKTRQALGLPI